MKMKMSRHSAILLALTALVCEGTWSFAASPANDAYELYRTGNTNQQQACIERLVAMSDEGLPYLDKLLAFEEKKEWSEAQNLLIDAVVRIGTERAADVLMARAQNYRCRVGCVDMTPRLANALARMGNKGLSRLLILSKQTEAYREPWFMPEWRAEKFIWFPKKQWRPTRAAGAACVAVASVNDPAAVPTLVVLIDSPKFRDTAFLALATMKSGGGEEKAVRHWENERNPVALKYLLVVDREKYLPLLREKLKFLDDELAKKKLGDSDWIVKVVYDLGGDSEANETLKRYVESKLWNDRYTERPVAFAILALGRSRDPGVKTMLLDLLKDSTQLSVSHSHSHGLPYLYMGSGRGFGTPMSMVAVKALQELGDPSVIPAIEQNMSTVPPEIENDEMNKGECRRFFENVLTTLRSKEKANPAPEDTARKLAVPQR
jgi:hypothetical protein